MSEEKEHGKPIARVPTSVDRKQIAKNINDNIKASDDRMSESFDVEQARLVLTPEQKRVRNELKGALPTDAILNAHDEDIKSQKDYDGYLEVTDDMNEGQEELDGFVYDYEDEIDMHIAVEKERGISDAHEKKVKEDARLYEVVKEDYNRIALYLKSLANVLDDSSNYAQVVDGLRKSRRCIILSPYQVERALTAIERFKKLSGRPSCEPLEGFDITDAQLATVLEGDNGILTDNDRAHHRAYNDMDIKDAELWMQEIEAAKIEGGEFVSVATNSVERTYYTGWIEDADDSGKVDLDVNMIKTEKVLYEARNFNKWSKSKGYAGKNSDGVEIIVDKIENKSINSTTRETPLSKLMGDVKNYDDTSIMHRED